MYISYETEGRYPRNREAYSRLAQFLGVETNYLLTEDEEFVSQAAEQYGSRGRRQAEALVSELSGLFAGGELSVRQTIKNIHRKNTERTKNKPLSERIYYGFILNIQKSK